MTAPAGPIVFNNSTGSDTEASGLGPSTAVFGTTGTSTSGSAVVTGITTTGVSAGHLFWANTSSGRQFSIIASVDSGSQVTLDDTLAANHSGNLTWAIGGKRRDWTCGTNRFLNKSDIKAGWSVDIEETGTDYALTSTAGGDFNNSAIGQSGNTTNGPITIYSSSATRPILSAHYGGSNAFTAVISGAMVVLRNLHLQNNVSATGPTALRVNNTDLIVEDCLIDRNGIGSAFSAADFSGGGTTIKNSQVIGSITFSSSSNEQAPVSITNTTVTERIIIGRHSGSVVKNTISSGITLNHSSMRRCIVTGNIVYNSTTSAIIVVHPNIAIGTVIEDNILVASANYGINFSGGSPLWSVCNRNAFYNNTSGEVNSVSNGPDDITLTADPFVNAAAGDFNLNSDAGGGQELRDTVLVVGSTERYPFAQWAVPSSGGGTGTVASSGGTSILSSGIIGRR